MIAVRFGMVAFSAAAAFAVAVPSYADTFQRLPAQVVSVVDCVPSVDTVVGNVEYPGGAVRAYLWTPGGGLTVVGTRGDESFASAVSANGKTVVGAYVKNGETSAFLWRKATGCIDIGGLGGDFAKANDVSAGGNVIVGTATDQEGGRRAFRATYQQALVGDLQNLGTLGGNNSDGLFVSTDGTVVVGRSQIASGDWHLFVWTKNEGMIDLGSLGGDEIVPHDISDDGSVIVGEAQNAAGEFVPFLAKKATGARRLPNVGDVRGSAEFVTGDGRFVFGQARVAGLTSRQAFRLKVANSQLWLIGSLLPGSISFASSADDDGQVVGGNSVGSSGRVEGFLRAPEMEGGVPVEVGSVLNKVFENDVLPRLRFEDVPCISANGRTFVAKGSVKGTGRPAFVHAQIDQYPAVIDENYFATRPYATEIAQYVDLTSTYTTNMYSAYGPVPAVYYAYLWAEYARQYQAVCASLVVDGVDDAATTSLYLQYRAAAISYAYYAYEYSYNHVYVSTGGTAAYSAEAAYYAYYSYYYQQLDYDELVGTP